MSLSKYIINVIKGCYCVLKNEVWQNRSHIYRIKGYAIILSVRVSFCPAVSDIACPYCGVSFCPVTRNWVRSSVPLEGRKWRMEVIAWIYRTYFETKNVLVVINKWIKWCNVLVKYQKYTGCCFLSVTKLLIVLPCKKSKIPASANLLLLWKLFFVAPMEKVNTSD